MDFRSNCEIHVVESFGWRRIDRFSLSWGESGAGSTFNDR